MASTEIEFIPDFEQLEEDIEDEEFEKTVNIGGQGQPGGQSLTPSQEKEQESIISGGVTEALAAAGVLGALLSQVKSITGLISAVLGAISRALVPTVEVIADLLRPFVDFFNDFIASPQEAVGNVVQSAERGAAAVASNPGRFLGGVIGGNNVPFVSAEEGAEFGEQAVDIASSLAPIIDIVFDVPSAADFTGAAAKNKKKDLFSQAVTEKTGGGT